MKEYFQEKVEAFLKQIKETPRLKSALLEWEEIDGRILPKIKIELYDVK